MDDDFSEVHLEGMWLGKAIECNYLRIKPMDLATDYTYVRRTVILVPSKTLNPSDVLDYNSHKSLPA